VRGADEQFRIFNVNSGLEIASFSGMKVQGGILPKSFGGGILSRSPLTLAQMHIVDNLASIGGGIALQLAGGTIIDSTINGNTATNRPAGIYLVDSGELPLRIINSTISGNQADGADGGILNGAGANPAPGISRMEVINSTITSNSGTITGGLASVSVGGSEASVVIRNSIIANNSFNNLGTFASTGTATIDSRGFNLSDTDSSEFLDHPTDRNNADAGLASLADNGGSTPTHALRASSEALGAGSNSGTGFLFDQRGWPFIRPVAGDGSDIGAYEDDEVFADGFE
jgi:parallel beta-helix repeat protein